MNDDIKEGLGCLAVCAGIALVIIAFAVAARIAA